MAIKQQVMALNPARKGNMGRLNSLTFPDFSRHFFTL